MTVAAARRGTRGGGTAGKRVTIAKAPRTANRKAAAKDLSGPYADFKGEIDKRMRSVVSRLDDQLNTFAATLTDLERAIKSEVHAMQQDAMQQMMVFDEFKHVSSVETKRATATLQRKERVIRAKTATTKKALYATPKKGQSKLMRKLKEEMRALEEADTEDDSMNYSL